MIRITSTIIFLFTFVLLYLNHGLWVIRITHKKSQFFKFFKIVRGSTSHITWINTSGFFSLTREIDLSHHDQISNIIIYLSVLKNESIQTWFRDVQLWMRLNKQKKTKHKSDKTGYKAIEGDTILKLTVLEDLVKILR